MNVCNFVKNKYLSMIELYYDVTLMKLRKIRVRTRA